MALAELDADERAALEADRIMVQRVGHAKDWLARHETIAQWMDDRALADLLLAEGYDYERLRSAGFTLPARDKLVSIAEHMPGIKRIPARPEADS